MPQAPIFRSRLVWAQRLLPTLQCNTLISINVAVDTAGKGCTIVTVRPGAPL